MSTTQMSRPSRSCIIPAYPRYTRYSVPRSSGVTHKQHNPPRGRWTTRSSRQRKARMEAHVTASTTPRILMIQRKVPILAEVYQSGTRGPRMTILILRISHRLSYHVVTAMTRGTISSSGEHMGGKARVVRCRCVCLATNLEKVHYGHRHTSTAMSELEPVFAAANSLIELSADLEAGFRQSVREAVVRSIWAPLGGVRYLYKSTAYKYEQECRIVLPHSAIADDKRIRYTHDGNARTGPIRHLLRGRISANQGYVRVRHSSHHRSMRTPQDRCASFRRYTSTESWARWNS